jgi:GxxExxY protein
MCTKRAQKCLLYGNLCALCETLCLITFLTPYQPLPSILQCMDDPDLQALTHRIIGLAMRVHTSLGPGLLEHAYERCLCHEFECNKIPYARQVDLPLDYDGTLIDCGYRADIIVDDRVILELKSVEHILPLHEAQLLTYLRMSHCHVGLLLNFNTVSLKDGIWRRIV